jgi:hypothetical protein
MQDAAIQTLVLQGLLAHGPFENGEALRSDRELDSNLRARVDRANSIDRDLLGFLQDLDEIPFNGPSGLKARTGIGEYRYDLV